jgi:hypothetical protein
MQDRNEHLDILNSKIGTLDNLLKEPMPEKAVSRTIALLPDQGEIVQLRGLDFVVRYVNKRTGKLHLEVRAAEHRNEAVTGQTCPSCMGDKYVYNSDGMPIDDCPQCKGTGQV